MNIITAPRPNSIRLSREDRHAQRPDGRHRQQRPAEAARADADRHRRPGPEVLADAVADQARQHRAEAQADVAQAHALLRQPQRARREQDVDHRAPSCCTSASRRRSWPAPPAACCCSTKRRPAFSSAQNSPAPAGGFSSTRMPRRIAADTSSSAASNSSAIGAPSSLISAPARPGPGDVGARARERVLRVGLDQPVALDHLRQHDLRGAAGRGVDHADDERHHVEPVDGQRVQPPRERDAGRRAGERDLAGDVDGQLAHAVEPHARRQREQHERQDLHRRERAHLRGRRVQQHRRGERQRQHHDLRAERAGEHRGPQAPVDDVAQQVVRAPARSARAARPACAAGRVGRSPRARSWPVSCSCLSFSLSSDHVARLVGGG